MVFMLASKVKEEHFSIPLAVMVNRLNASCAFTTVIHSPKSIADFAKEGAPLSLQCCNECTLSTCCIANDTECLSSSEGSGLSDGFHKLC